MKKQSHKNHEDKNHEVPAPSAAPGNAKPQLKRKAYEKELRALQAELCGLQEWVKHTGQRII
ncbi:MAG: hypothetical protein ACFCVA_05675, partial [Gammaproteobacteria bacterium]